VNLHNDRIPDEQIMAFLDDAETYRLNGLLLKIDEFPVENDKISWDLGWIQRADWIVREAGKRGVYVQISIFNTWSRDPRTWFEDTLNGQNHVFNVWQDGDDEAKENYIRTIIARFAGYYNVYWELGNEMSHAPNSGSTFERLARTKYLPWLRQYDPYDLPIGLSEPKLSKTMAGIDIVFAHRGWEFLPDGSQQAWIANELAVSWTYGKMLCNNPEMRDPTSRLGYRRIFWRQFVSGGSGASTASWLLIKNWTNDTNKSAALTVMADQRRLREFIEALPLPFTEMDAVNGLVTSAPGIEDVRSRGKAGEVYVTYVLAESDPPNANVPSGMPSSMTPPELITHSCWINE